jgi:N-acetylglucosaminyl-diphospho-decaprenol L-rhamnosyltransferase
VIASIIIVNWKVRELLRQCLRSVFEAGGLAPGDYEVFVVDNDSRDGSVEMVAEEFPHVRLLANAKNLGFGAANDQAYALSQGEFVVLLNPDTLVKEGALSTLVERMRARPEVAIMGCRLLNADGSLQKWTGGAFPSIRNLMGHYFFLDRLLPRSMRAAPLYLDRDVAEEMNVGWVCGACLVARREAIGARIFDPAFFMYGEDMELCHRMGREGRGLVVYTPHASIIHYQGESMKQQTGDVLLSSIKGPRQFFSLTRGRRWVWLFDIITMTGFGLRWLLYRAAAVASQGAAAKAASSRQYMQLAWRLMRTPG